MIDLFFDPICSIGEIYKIFSDCNIKNKFDNIINDKYSVITISNLNLTKVKILYWFRVIYLITKYRKRFLDEKNRE